MYSSFLGIDVSKATFDVAFLINNKIRTKKFNNNPRGFFELMKWLQNKEINSMHACMEATGGYEKKLARCLYDNNIKVSIVNLARIKGFSISKLCRVKTDKADCELIAYFCQAMQPDLWQPTPLHIDELQQLVKRLDALVANKNQETNRLLKETNSKVIESLRIHVEFLNKQISEIKKLISIHIKQHKDLSDKENLLASIPGVGERTRSVILGFLNMDNFTSAKQLAAFVGINPKIKQSGSSVYGTGRISKTGDSAFRKAFYMPAVVATKANPMVKEFAERLSNRGKSRMVVVIAAMRKLLHIIFGVLKNKTCFNPDITKLNDKITQKAIAI